MNHHGYYCVVAMIMALFGATLSAEDELPHELIEVVAEVPGGFKVVPEDPAAADAVWDAAHELPFVSLSLRGPAGIQQDLSLMGGLFEQAGVSFDGIGIGDLQTAHHDLDTAIIPAEVAYFELMPAAAGYGGDALTGTLDIGLKVPRGNALAMWGGDYGLFRAYGHHGTATGRGGTTFSFGGGYDYARSDGWRPGTDFETVSLALSAERTGPSGDTFVRFGFSDRSFGAQDFYAPYPSEEDTDSEMFLIRHRSPETAELPFEVYALLKRHGDLFILDRTDPPLYTAKHTSVVSAVGARASFGKTTLTTEFRGETLSSSSLGARDRATGHIGLAVNSSENDPSLNISAGLDVIDSTPEYTLSGRALIPLDSEERRSVSLLLAKTYRMPSMTDLYYLSPANVGDQNLEPEHAKQVVLSIEMDRASLYFFRRRTENLIDWIRYDPADPWQATNIGDVETSGLGLACKANWAEGHVRLYAEFMNTDTAEVTYESKYVRYVKRRIGASGASTLGGGLSLEYSIETLRRRGWSDSVILADLFLVWREADWEARIGATNLFDEIYEDVPGAEAPGRWLAAGLSYSW